jgi:hypothetical protein
LNTQYSILNLFQHYEHSLSYVAKVMRILKLYIAIFVFGVQILAFPSCQSLDERPMETSGMIEAGKGTAVLSLFEEIDLIALALIQHESINNRTLTLTVEGFCQETLITKNTKEKSVTADFGNGCISAKGVKREGILKVFSNGNFWSNGSVTQIIMDGFFIDGVKVSGVRTLTNNGFDQVNHVLNFKSVMHGGEVTWPMESQPLITEYLHERTISLPTAKEGFTFSLMGKTEITDKKGNSLVLEIVKPVIFQESCMRYGTPTPSSGSLTISRSKSETLLVNFSAACQ